jgi:hypothetical protein
MDRTNRKMSFTLVLAEFYAHPGMVIELISLDGVVSVHQRCRDEVGVVSHWNGRDRNQSIRSVELLISPSYRIFERS